MLRYLLLTFALLVGFCGISFSQSTTELQGVVTDDKGETLIGASVKVLTGTDLARGAITDTDGRYRVRLDPGTYNVEVSYTGFATARINSVQVLVGRINFLDVTMSTNTVLNEVVISDYQVKLVEQDKTSGGQVLTAAQIRNLPTRSVSQIVATTAGTTTNEAGDINIKGSRSNATNYYIDGIRVSGTPPPVQDIEQLSVVTGGLGAEFGDVTGGVISVVTKGPASEYHGTAEVENSYGLDPYGWLLATANVSGPLLKRRSADGTSRSTLIGFRLSGQYLGQKDDDPPATSVYRPRPEVLNRLITNPLQLQNGIPIVAAESLTTDSMEVLNYNPNSERRDIDLTGKLDFRLTDRIDFSVTGTYKDTENKFTPSESNGDTWRVFNSQNNPTRYNKRYRAIARFRHRLGTESSEKSGDKSLISNASYQLQFGFERGTEDLYDPRHNDRLFDYGYAGRFNYAVNPLVVVNPETGKGEHIDNQISYTGFQAGYVNGAGETVIPNPGLLAYNEFADFSTDNPFAINTFVARNGFFSAVYNNVWSNMHTNVNWVYNRFSKQEDDIITVQASTNFDLNLGATGTHSIQIGILNEQRTNRFFRVSPRNLWILMLLQSNSHFNGLDTTRVLYKIDGSFTPTGDSIPIYANLAQEQSDNRFYKAIRQQLGIGLDQYVNSDLLSPEQLNLSLFSPLELTGLDLVDYNGYDYTGKKTSDNVTFNDFFTKTSADGVREFPVAPLRPLYQAAYIKDKFTFNKMIFSLGVRVEILDLNTRVMKDPYSLYQIQTAKDYHNTNPNAPARPNTIGDDFKVYVESSTDPTIKAYRNGDTWYFADGRQANDGNVIFGGGVVAPLLADPTRGGDIASRDFDPNTAFEDYKPQVNWLPRLAFSFPISEEANFFAHYDILVQRPPDGWQVTPLDYLYFYVPSRTTVNNANLRPERVVDYEVGFQQLLSKNSALKFSAYYREMRDMIQRRTVLYVPVIGRYDTYGNIDFGTVKGFTLQYDLRRIQNAEFRLAYTLQFAEGTGSDQNSQRGLTSRGNIRSLFPLNFDERHNIQAILDYRFGSGDKYNGPSLGGVDILSRFGVNLQMAAVSGRPYTAKIRPTRFDAQGTLGAINGNRLPWRFNVDLRIDKSFVLTPNGRTPLNLNVYLRVSNLLDRLNVLGVYEATGSPTDDGYLATGEGQSIVRGITERGQNEQAYLDAYSWRLLNPNNYAQPRRFFIGAAFEF